MQSKQSTLDQSNSPTPESPADTDFDETDDSSLRLSYQNEIGNAIVIRKYQNHTEFVRETDEEWMYNYRLGEWECVHRFVHDYDLSDDGETLAGDGSNWRGTARNWSEWFTQRHYERLPIRFPNDEPPKSPDEHDAVASPAGDTAVPAP
jgi:hypothetical protein